MLQKQRSKSVSVEKVIQRGLVDAHDLMLRLNEPSVLDWILLAMRKERERAFGSRVERRHKVGVAFAVKGEVCASASKQVLGVLVGHGRVSVRLWE